MYDPNATKLYTDGSARPNPGNGGVGVVVEFQDESGLDQIEISEGYRLSTNNRMELLAVIRGIEWLVANATEHGVTRAILITDSEYVHSNHNNAPYWKKQGWQTTEGKPYENPDLWDTFLKVRAKLRTPFEIRWAKGKQSDVLLLVDALAKQGASNPTRDDSGYRPGKFTATRTPSKKAATLSEVNGVALIRVYRSEIFGRHSTQTYKISFDLYDESNSCYIGKHVAYTRKDFNLKRNTCYQVTLGGSKTFPIITEAEEVEYLKGS